MAALSGSSRSRGMRSALPKKPRAVSPRATRGQKGASVAVSSWASAAPPVPRRTERVPSAHSGEASARAAERLVLRPHHKGGTVVPAVHRVAVVAHVALVFGGVGRQLHRRDAGTDIRWVDRERHGLWLTVGGVDPADERDVPVD